MIGMDFAWLANPENLCENKDPCEWKVFYSSWADVVSLHSSIYWKKTKNFLKTLEITSSQIAAVPQLEMLSLLPQKTSLIQTLSHIYDILVWVGFVMSYSFSVTCHPQLISVYGGVLAMYSICLAMYSLWGIFNKCVQITYSVFALQPDISKFASELLPLLFQYLERAAKEADKNPRGLTKSYYALEMFCENLGKCGM